MTDTRARANHPDRRHRAASIVALGVGLVALAAVFAPHAAVAGAAGPFGVGAPETTVPLGGNGFLGSFFFWVAAEQSQFYRALTSALKALRNDPNAAILLAGLSFAYGVFHAAGPGHGKAVVASYVLANGETLRRGIVLSFVSAFVQALVAIALVGTATWALHLTSIEMTRATTQFEWASALMITALGVWLTWSKLVRPFLFGPPAGARVANGRGNGTGTAEMSPAGPAGPAVAEMSIGTVAVRSGLSTGSKTFAPAGLAPAATAGTLRFRNVPAGVDLSALESACPGCGFDHFPDPSHLAGPMNWRRALSAVVAVGIRPCTGALIVLVFAFAQGLHLAGVLSVLAMAVGTGLTVAVLATLTVSARSVALRLAGADAAWGLRIVRAGEIFGALLVLAVGVTLLGAVIVGAPTGG